MPHITSIGRKCCEVKGGPHDGGTIISFDDKWPVTIFLERHPRSDGLSYPSWSLVASAEFSVRYVLTGADAMARYLWIGR